MYVCIKTVLIYEAGSSRLRQTPKILEPYAPDDTWKDQSDEFLSFLAFLDLLDHRTWQLVHRLGIHTRKWISSSIVIQPVLSSKMQVQEANAIPELSMKNYVDGIPVSWVETFFSFWI